MKTENGRFTTHAADHSDCQDRGDSGPCDCSCHGREATTPQTGHEINGYHYLDDGSVTAFCLCGWSGNESGEDAAGDAFDEHYREAIAKATNKPEAKRNYRSEYQHEFLPTNKPEGPDGR